MLVEHSESKSSILYETFNGYRLSDVYCMFPIAALNIQHKMMSMKIGVEACESVMMRNHIKLWKTTFDFDNG